MTGRVSCFQGVLLVAVAAAAPACKPASQRVTEQVEAAASWGATAEMAAAAWARNAVPARFAERTIEEAHAHLHAAAKQMTRLRRQPGGDDGYDAISAAERAVSDLAEAVRRRDDSVLRARVRVVASARERLDTLHDRLEKTQ